MAASWRQGQRWMALPARSLRCDGFHICAVRAACAVARVHSTRKYAYTTAAVPLKRDAPLTAACV